MNVKWLGKGQNLLGSWTGAIDRGQQLFSREKKGRRLFPKKRGKDFIYYSISSKAEAVLTIRRAEASLEISRFYRVCWTGFLVLPLYFFLVSSCLKNKMFPFYSVLWPCCGRLWGLSLTQLHIRVWSALVIFLFSFYLNMKFDIFICVYSIPF